MEPRYYLSSKINKEGRASVMLFVSTHGKRITISTGKFIKPVNWNEKAQRARGNTKEVLDFNSHLISFGSRAISTLSTLIENQEPEIVKVFKERIKLKQEEVKVKTTNNLNGTGGSFLAFIKNYAETTSKSKATAGQYESTLTLLKQFQKTTFKKPLDFETIDMVFYDQFVLFCQSEQDYAVNTIGKYIKNIKFLMGESEANDLHTNLKFKSKKFKKPVEESFSIFLSEGEIQKMCDYDFTDSPELEKARDLFVASCWMGVRISDLMILGKENLKQNTVTFRVTKTNEFVEIPLHRLVKKIISKYGGGLPNNFSKKDYNEKLKTVGEKVGFTENVSYTITKGGVKKKIVEPKYNLITAHTARRSFATNLYKRGIPIQTIMAITGHETEKSFRLYIKSKRIDGVKNLNAYFNE